MIDDITLPITYDPTNSRLEWFAGCALIGLLQNRVPMSAEWNAKVQSKAAIHIAKAMIEELNKLREESNG